jgi:hypothetical protein
LMFVNRKKRSETVRYVKLPLRGIVAPILRRVQEYVDDELESDTIQLGCQTNDKFHSLFEYETKNVRELITALQLLEKED